MAACHPWQHAAVTDPSRRISFLAGRGGGKTTTFRARACIKGTRIERARLVYIATTRSQAEELNWIPLKDMIDGLGLTDEVTFNESKLRCTFHRTGAMYRLVGADDKREIEKLRGQPFDEVQVDEGASHDLALLDQLVFRVVGPRLGERNGVMLIGGTPGHDLSGLFYDITRPGSPLHRPFGQDDGWTGWSSHCWTAKDVAELPDAATRFRAIYRNWAEALIEKDTNKWSDDHPVWQREYLAQWAADDTENVYKYRPHKDGLEWNRWDPFGEHKLDGVAGLKAALEVLRKDRKDWHFAIAMDMGHADPFACIVLAFSPTDPDKRIWQVFDFEKTGMYAKPIAEILIGPELNAQKPGGIFGVTGWPDGLVIDGDQPLIEELANVYGIRVKKAEKKPEYKFGAIELVNGDLIDGRIKVLKGSKLETQLQGLQWVANEFGQLRENKKQANHSTDALIYGRKLIAHLFESGAVVQEQTKTAAYVDPQGLASPEEHNPTGEDHSDLLSSGEFEEMWG